MPTDGSDQGIPDTMIAAVLAGPGRVDVRPVPTPTPDADEVLVAVDLCGICGSDLHMVLEGWARPGTWQGHEWVGTVAAAGPEVSAWKVGDRVVGGPARGCGECRSCRLGRPSLCEALVAAGSGGGQGAFATYKLSAPDELLALPAGLDPRAAALAEPLAVALHAVHQGGVQPGMRVVVFGAGPIGALALAAMAAMGVDDLVCVEPAPVRRELARSVGAREVVLPEEVEVPSIAEPQRMVAGAADVVLECSGQRAAMEAGLAQLVRAGTLVLVGAGIDPPRFDPNRILLNELVVTGAFNYDAGGFTEALELLASGRLPVEELVEPGAVPLEGLIDAMRDLAAGLVAGKVLVRP
ncbi:MAG: alcohol dehydrogenase catalytic domain-containing protein [Acidobacteria bacterium]|nr:alcohol dehydrogenase catalytic domain-containing protein [Acidobacteriota bacterium]